MNPVGQALQEFTFVLLPCLGALATWLILRSSVLDRLDFRRWVWVAVGAFLATRLSIHILVFPLFRYAGGDDLLRVWVPIARAVLEGRDPVPHLDNLYGPFYPLVLAAGYGLTGGRHAPGIDIPFIVADACALVLLFRVAARRMSTALARRLTLAVLLSPLLWHNEIVRTQDESMFVLFLLLTLDLLDRGRELPGALAAALGTLCTKAVFPLWVFPILVSAGGGWRKTGLRITMAASLTVAGMAAYPAFGWDFPGSFHPVIDVRGSTTWFLVPGGAHASGTAFRVGLGLTTVLVALAGGWAATRAGDIRDRAYCGVVAAQAVFFVACPFTLPPHLVQGLPFLAWQAVREETRSSKPGWKGRLLGLGFCLWQIPSVWLNSEFWREYPWLIAAFAAFWAWTGWLALRPTWLPHRPPPDSPLPSGAGGQEC